MISAYIKQVLPFLVTCGAAAIVLYLWMGQRSLAPAYLTGEDEDR